MKAVIVQGASGPHVELLRATFATHSKYAQRHGIAMSTHILEAPVRNATWMKVGIIITALQSFDCAIWIDSDCFIVDHSQSIADECKPNSIGMVWHRTLCLQDLGVFNAGVMVVPRALRELLWTIWCVGPPMFLPWDDNGTFILELKKSPDMVHRIDNRWNHGPASPSDSPAIVGLHGIHIDRTSRLFAEASRSEPAKRLAILEGAWR